MSDAIGYCLGCRTIVEELMTATLCARCSSEQEPAPYIKRCVGCGVRIWDGPQPCKACDARLKARRESILSKHGIVEQTLMDLALMGDD